MACLAPNSAQAIIPQLDALLDVIKQTEVVKRLVVRILRADCAPSGSYVGVGVKQVYEGA